MANLTAESDPDSDLIERLSTIISRYRKYYGLYLVILPLCLLFAFLIVSGAKRQFTAVAVVGPAMNNLSVDSAGGLAGLASLGRGIGLGSLVQDSNGFDAYRQMLTTHRLAIRLIEKYDVLPIIFSDRWDAQTHQWKPRQGTFALTLDFLRRQASLPVKIAPDEDDLITFLRNKLRVITSRDSQLDTINLTYESPAGAELLLTQILTEADNLIREDKRRDVAARITYLQDALQKVIPTDQRSTMISVLSTQQQSMTMIMADQRFASTMVDSPHSSSRPTYPDPVGAFFVTIIVSFLIWTCVLLWLPSSRKARSRH